MATKEFNTKQKEIVARKMGYDGPMQMFDNFLRSDPAMARKYGIVVDKYMAKGGAVMRAKNGGAVKKYQEGGLTLIKDTSSPPPAGGPLPSWLTPPPPMTPVTQALTTYTNPYTGETYTANTGGYTVNAQPPSTMPVTINPALPVNTTPNLPFAGVSLPATGGPQNPSALPSGPSIGPINPALPSTGPALPSTGPAPATTLPIKPATPTVTAATVTAPTTASGQLVTAADAPAAAVTVTPTTAPAATTITAEPKTTAATVTADLAQTDVEKALATLRAEQGQVSKEAQVQAQTMAPTATAVSQLQAAQGVTGKVEGAPTRTLQSGEVIEGATVDRKAVEEAIAKTEAAQGKVTEDMTVQGQLSRLVTDFEVGNPPAWAAASMRNVTAQLAQRGIGASSLAGQALIQATLEAAIPIAAQDAQVYKDMGIQNLSNKQQVAVLAAQQRAQFLGQEFDQSFQARVINASTISQIANVNFEAKQQVALENARLAQTMNLANLNNRQALIIAEASQIATLEVANLNNRQQAAVLNAQAFLAMDMTNLDNRQQATMFKAQSVFTSILSDQAAENAAKQFNAASQNQVDQFYASLTSQVKQYNATQTNAMSQFNTEQSNAIKQFNASVQNQRDQFNVENRRVIDQSNAEWRRNIATMNTAAVNRANEINANNALTLTTAEYNNLWQKYRDDIEYSWKTGENVLDRESELAKQILSKEATIEAAQFQVEAAKYQALGNLAATLLDKAGAGEVIGEVLGAAAGFLWGSASTAATSIIKGFTTVKDKLKTGTAIDNLPKFTKPVAGNVKITIPGVGTRSYSDDYLNFISDTYKVTKGSDQANMLAEQDSWFYDN